MKQFKFSLKLIVIFISLNIVCNPSSAYNKEQMVDKFSSYKSLNDHARTLWMLPMAHTTISPPPGPGPLNREVAPVEEEPHWTRDQYFYFDQLESRPMAMLNREYHTENGKPISRITLLPAPHAQFLDRQPKVEGMPYKPYAFAYTIFDEFKNRMERQEKQDANGYVVGSYGYTDMNGKMRRVSYYTDETGFHATDAVVEDGNSNSYSNNGNSNEPNSAKFKSSNGDDVGTKAKATTGTTSNKFPTVPPLMHSGDIRQSLMELLNGGDWSNLPLCDGDDVDEVDGDEEEDEDEGAGENEVNIKNNKPNMPAKRLPNGNGGGGDGGSIGNWPNKSNQGAGGQYSAINIIKAYLNSKANAKNFNK